MFEAWAEALGPIMAVCAALGWLKFYKSKDRKRRMLSVIWAGTWAWLSYQFYWVKPDVSKVRLFYPLIGLACLFAADFLVGETKVGLGSTPGKAGPEKQRGSGPADLRRGPWTQ